MKMISISLLKVGPKINFIAQTHQAKNPNLVHKVITYFTYFNLGENMDFLEQCNIEFFILFGQLLAGGFVLRVPMITYRSALAGYCIDSSRNQGNVTNELKAWILG